MQERQPPPAPEHDAPEHPAPESDAPEQDPAAPDALAPTMEVGADEDEGAEALEAAAVAARLAELEAIREAERLAALEAATAAAAIEGRHVLIVGLGETGLAMARWAHSKGAVVTVADSRQHPPGLEALSAACPAVRVVTGALDAGLLQGVDLVGWSQGLSPTQGDAAALHAAALAAGLPVWGELEFFARELARLRAAGYRTKLIAITGTNGKTTTTRLAGHLCRQAGLRVAVAGNISPAALDVLRESIAHDDLPEIWVLELASFQLALTDSFAADCATVLNLTQDHLDWHGTMAEYVAAKHRIYAAGTVCVVNRDDPLTVPAAGPVTRAGGRRADRLERSNREAPRSLIAFGLDAPVAAPGYGIVREGGLAWLVEAVADEDIPRRRKAPTEIRLNRLMPADALRLRGAHNHANALAALALCRAAGVPMAAMLHGLRSFEGEPHRCALVSVIRDIEWYDDSKGTNVGATVAALSGLGRRCVLIAGGDGKGQDFSPLAAAVARHASAVMLIGRDAPAIRSALAPTGIPITDCATLDAAVEAAAATARAGEAVLLSPACASFDMFRNYGHRAEVFTAAVHRIAEEDGQPC
jgi:UDP-N-acetylmuramoylalanine--D-glutamate ligase